MKLSFLDFANRTIITTDGVSAFYRKMDGDHESVDDPICTDPIRIEKLDNAVRMPAGKLAARVLVDSDRMIEILNQVGAGCVEISIYENVKDSPGYFIAVSGTDQAAAVMSMYIEREYWHPFQK